MIDFVNPNAIQHNPQKKLFIYTQYNTYLQIHFETKCELDYPLKTIKNEPVILGIETDEKQVAKGYVSRLKDPAIVTHLEFFEKPKKILHIIQPSITSFSKFGQQSSLNTDQLKILSCTILLNRKIRKIIENNDFQRYFHKVEKNSLMKNEESKKTLEITNQMTS